MNSDTPHTEASEVRSSAESNVLPGRTPNLDELLQVIEQQRDLINQMLAARTVSTVGVMSPEPENVALMSRALTHYSSVQPEDEAAVQAAAIAAAIVQDSERVVERSRSRDDDDERVVERSRSRDDVDETRDREEEEELTPTEIVEEADVTTDSAVETDTARQPVRRNLYQSLAREAEIESGAGFVSHGTAER